MQIGTDPWPLVLLGLRIAVAGALYLFLFAAFRTLWAELRAAPAEAAAPAPAEAAQPARREWLEVIACDGDGALVGRRYPLTGESLVGRGAHSEVVLPDRRVSSRHARLVPEDGAWWVEDLGSTNGTYVDRRRVEDAAWLDEGAELRFGPVVARLRREPAREPAAARAR